MGRLESPQAVLSLRYDHVDQPDRRFTLDRRHALYGDTLRRYWAGKKLQELLVSPQQNKNEIVALAQRYGLVTPFTSLMVLENLWQYVEYRIEPPKTQPAMRDQYRQMVGQQEKQQQAERGNKIDEVARLWDARVKWWETDFPWPPKAEKRSGDRPMFTSPVPSYPLIPPGGRVYSAMGSGMGGGFGGMGGGMAGGMGASGSMGGMGGGFGAGMGGGMGSMGGGMGGMGGGTGIPSVPPSNPGGPFAAGSPPTSVVENFEITRPAAPRGPRVVTQEWDPAAPYLSQLRAAPREAAFAVYMKNRAKYGNSPIFFLDCADYFFKQHNSEWRCRSSATWRKWTGRIPLPLRILGHRLALAGEFDLAVATLEKVLNLWPDNPQSYRDLALVLTQRAAPPKGSGPAPSGYSLGGLFCHPAGRDSDYQRAVDLLSEVVTRHWDFRYGQWELPALMDLNRLLRRARQR